MKRALYTGLLLATTGLHGCSCGSSAGPGLDDFLPEIPDPTGETQSVFAGEVTDESELVDGPAKSGVIGDFYIRNAAGHFIIQSPERVIGVVPQGGNLIDVVPLDTDGNPSQPDHFGELSMIYLLGRTCEHESIEVVADGSGGGVAAIRARGFARSNDFFSIQGIGLINVPGDQNPDRDDGVECATTYILHPDARSIEVHWTLYNPQDQSIKGPFATFADTGGVVEGWSPELGFERLGIDTIVSGSAEAPIEYVVYQGPDVAYGMLPRNPGAPNFSAIIAGVSVIVYSADDFLDITNADSFHLDIEPESGTTVVMDVGVGHDAADMEELFRTQADPTVAMADVSGTVTFDSGDPANRARVGLYSDVDGNGELDDDDTIISYFDADFDGAFAGRVLPGNYLLRADVPNEGRSPVTTLDLTAAGAPGLALEIPLPVTYDYTITDDLGASSPSKLVIVGRNPAPADKRVHSTADIRNDVVDMVYSIRGTSIGTGADEPFSLAAGGKYRIFATRGTEYDVDSVLVEPQAGDPRSELTFSLTHVVDVPGYLSTEYHVHSIGSPDSIVDQDIRVKTAVADGIELFAATDHDFVGVLQPMIEALGLEQLVRSIPGIEVTPFAYGHFNAYPIEPVLSSPNRGAIDWARNDQGFALIPDEIFTAMRDRGAELVQVNHPRNGGFQQYFDRAALSFDYDTNSIFGSELDQPAPNDWLRLPPGAPLWSANFNALEVWNGFETGDTNADGVREIISLDRVMHDWFNFLSFGLAITPIGNSDTHTIKKDPMGMPRTFVRVPDDGPGVVANPSIIDAVLDTLAGRSSTPVDVVVTNGPHISVQVNGAPDVLGQTIDGTGGSFTLEITVMAADWAVFDTVEIFANTTPDPDSTALEPLACFTNRPPAEIMASDPCALATLGGAQVLTVQEVQLGGGITRLEATVSLTIAAIDIINRAGAQGTDAWFVVRARGDRSIFPIHVDDVLGGTSTDIIVDPQNVGELESVLVGAGIPAAAFTSPFYVDFDGGGYKAPFDPQ